MQVGSITTNLKVEIDFTLPEINATKIVTWNCHVDNSAKVGYDMILVRYILRYLVLNLKLSYHIIEVYDGTLKSSTAPMVDISTYEFKYL